MSKHTTLIDLICEYCNELFKRRKGNIRNRHYCSKECFSKSRSRSKLIDCNNCSKEILKSNADIKKSKSGNFFCSRSCAATYNNRTSPKRKPLGKCKICSKSIKSSRLYCSVECRDKSRRPKISQNERLNNAKNAVISYRQRMKKRAVEYKGGSCKICGYNKCFRALSFHHIDPKTKDFTISGLTYKWARIKAEIDKCILVCLNCHSEIHSGLITL